MSSFRAGRLKIMVKGNKRYAAVVHAGRASRLLRRGFFKKATAALAYSGRFVDKWDSLHIEKK